MYSQIETQSSDLTFTSYISKETQKLHNIHSEIQIPMIIWLQSTSNNLTLSSPYE